MKAFQLQNIGEKPGIVDISVPNPGPGQVRLRIMACGLNFADLLMAAGTYQEKPALPTTLGMEVSGVVDQVGPDVGTLSIGDRVAIFAGHGGLAEYGVFDANRAIPLPASMPFDHAAGFMVAYGTSHLALTHRAKLSAGETLVVLGAAGGVGLTAVEIGALLGANVVAVARGEAKLDAAKHAGAHHLIDSEAGNLREALKALGGVDVIYDPVGGALFADTLRATKPLARAIVVGFASGDVPQIAANRLLVKNTDVLGFYWGGYMTFAPNLVTDSLAQLLGWYAEGRVKPHLSHTLPLDQAAQGMELLRSRKSTGKVVITMG